MLPAKPEDQAARREQVRNGFQRRFTASAERYRSQLASWYPAEAAQAIQAAEAFELCEYGRQPSRVELRKLFPDPTAK